jgi:uncharacterized protein
VEQLLVIGSFSPEPFVPAVGLNNAHLQTLAAALLGRAQFTPTTEQWLITVASQNQVRCDCSWQPQLEKHTTALICHGFGGSSHSPLVIGMAAALWKSGMNVVRYNMRNCGGTEAVCRTLYHSGMYGDIIHVIDALLARGCDSIVLIGFSAGGNLMLNTAAAYGAQAPAQVKAAISICGSLDVAAAADALHQGVSRLYEKVFLRELIELFRTKARLFPEIFRLSFLRRFHSVREFDNDITAPYSGYRDADDIYSAISCSRWLERIAIPTLVLHAKDDPFIRLLPLTREKLKANAEVCFLETDRGGHCGFVARGRRWWAEELVESFIAAATCKPATSVGNA